MANDGEDHLPEWVEVLGRGPIRVTELTDENELATEMGERLDALLKSHNGLEPNATGWRQLALELALKYDPLFRIDTPDDRSNTGGRPVGMGNFMLRSRMKANMRGGQSQAEAARTISKQSKGEISFKTANNALSRKGQAPDFMRRWPHEWKADRAMRLAAAKLSQE
ncbi:hypothetical protein GGQ64_004130 [Rhizobium azooxidifex]|uniref:Uncharacterized protein n=1 Tax=Mycoplana azooxidifex TaxID=1636188 RepID=A0A7W6D911_9HYPH|nr:hypothetical protein [Mycoplana azooxidifex]MBB3978895.1 hypothetical protein [Mycoplana azooxidifex]